MPDGERISYAYFTAFDWFTWLQDKTELYLPGRDKCGEVQPDSPTTVLKVCTALSPCSLAETLVEYTANLQ